VVEEHGRVPHGGVSLPIVPPGVTGYLQEGEGAHYVGSDEGLGPQDGPVHVTFRGKMDHCINPVLREDPFYPGPVTDIPLLEEVSLPPIGPLNGNQVLRVSRIGEGIEVHDAAFEIRFLQQVVDEVRSDESRSTCDQDAG